VVLAVGARFNGQASSATALSEHRLGMARESRLAAAGDRHQRHAEPLEHRKDRAQLLAFAGVADRQHEILRRHHAEVAVAGLGRVHEHRRRAGGGQRGGDLAPDVAALAHAHHDHAAAAGEHQVDGAHEGVGHRAGDARLQGEQRLRLDGERLRAESATLRPGFGDRHRPGGLHRVCPGRRAGDLG
jgi:hypothetical protein